MKLPLRIQRYDASFAVRDANDTLILYVYFDKGSPGERAIRKLMSEEEAEELVKRMARLLTDDETKKGAATPKDDGAQV